MPIEKYPYIVSVVQHHLHYCSGCIFNENNIITTADCANRIDAENFYIKAGVNSTDKRGSMHRIYSVKMHENYIDFYNGTTPRNDIAIMKIAPPLRFDTTTSPIELYDSEDEIKEGQISSVLGYQTTEDSEWYIRHLMAAKVPIVSRKECNRMYQSKYHQEVGEDYICGFTDDNDKTLCRGDFGDPVVIKGQLVGITSTALDCAEAGMPALYTNIAHFQKWIADNTS